MSNTDEPLEPDLANILEQAKPLDRVPPGASERILDGLAARLAAPSSGGRGASHPASGARLLSRPVVVGLASFVAGAAVGAVLRQPPAPVERVVYVDRVTGPTSPAAPGVVPGPAEESPASPSPPLGALPATSATHHTSPLPPADREQLAAESALLDVARVAVARGEGDRALAAVSRHASEFPRGLLTEEREALAVKALRLVGRDQDARARADAFGRTYPESIFLPGVRAASQP